MKNNQKGFSIIEVLIVLLVLALIGTAGWFAYNNQESKKLANVANHNEDSNAMKKYRHEIREGYCFTKILNSSFSIQKHGNNMS
ncbi:MAG: prepilin-type N-terminal cleavage/methylation domain-containing protein [bacterium]|nr:prepilin-type N-terminal cleavage/methylation domain-containing protein [bacterium]